MRNLRSVRHLTFEDQTLGPVGHCAWDVQSDAVIFTCGPTEHSTLLELRRICIHDDEGRLFSKSKLIAAWDAPCPNPDLSHDVVINIHHFSDTLSTCLVLAGGDIIVVREQPVAGEDKIEIVGSVDAGIAAAQWAPDDELLAICTNGQTLLFMTRAFDNVATAHFLSDDVNLSKHVSVGWGKAETQFRGKGAKALRDPTMPEKVEAGLLSRNENRCTAISWRGDGQFVAVNTLQASPRRVIRIYTREGILDGVTEPVDFLEGALSWRPAGNLFAGIQRCESQIKVILFERNGLRHGEFLLRLPSDVLEDWANSIQLDWNMDSTTLAVIFENRVQLWTMGNYHYYLKNEILLPSGSRISSFKWHPERYLAFTVGMTGAQGGLKALEYIFNICRDDINQPHDYGTVAVIDGEYLKLTDLRYSNIPPPMASYEVLIGENIVDCAIISSGTKTRRLAALTSTKICIIEWTVKEASKSPIMTHKYPLDKYLNSIEHGKGPVSVRTVISSGTKLIVLFSVGHGSRLLVIETEEPMSYDLPAHDLGEIRQIRQGFTENNGEFYIALYDGRVIQLCGESNNDLISRNSNMGVLPVAWDYFDVFIVQEALRKDFADTAERDSTQLLASMTSNGHLYANQRLISTGCTSFIVTKDHIIFTTAKHLLKFVHVSTIDLLEVPPDTPEEDERCRSVERGARIVTAIPSRSALILQMPRGNLETIYPRALVLAEIRRDINRQNYKRAFLSCRSQRVDMNILHDYSPRSFSKDIHLFIRQVEKVEHIDLFLSQLRNEDVTVTMYKETIRNTVEENKNSDPGTIKGRLSFSTEEKVNLICEGFIQSLRSMGKLRLQNLITAYVCKTPPDLTAALMEVSKLQEEGSGDMQSAIEHICFLVDVNKLFDAALGLYDLKLALLVAQQSQKDPREYLPFLNGLNSQENVRMRFAIDDHLGRRQRCLEHLQGLDAFEELKQYVVKYELHDEALELYRHQDDKTAELMQLFATHLAAQSRHREAGIAYEFLGDYESACEAYRLAHCWREALACAYAVPFSSSQMQALTQNLCEGLIELNDFLAAGTIMFEHVGDVETAARFFCKGYLFSDANRILSLSGKRDLLVDIVDTGLGESMSVVIEMLADFKSQLNAQVPRIAELREKKEQEPLKFYDASANEGVDIPDNVSLAATDASTMGGTLFTRYTNRTGTVGTNATRKTSKNKRREERKRARGKKGSVYEEEYLVNSVCRLVERVNSVQDDVGRLIVGLTQRRMRERAKAVQEAMRSVVDLCEQSIVKVFSAEPSNQNEGVTEQSNREQENDSMGNMHWMNMEAFRSRTEMPKVKAFARLSLVSNTQDASSK